MSDRLAFVLLAGGQGVRLNQDTPKQFIRVAGDGDKPCPDF